MKVTRHSDLSIRLLIYLAISQGHTISVAEVSKKFDSSRNHLGKVVSQLAELGYLRTMRGKGGGMQLAKEPPDINIGEVVEQMEPVGDLIDCHNPKCPLADNCTFKLALDAGRNAFRTALAKFTLADLTRDAGRLRALIGD